MSQTSPYSDPPVKLTPKQANIYCWGFQKKARFRDAVCGRRFGKTFLGKAEIRRAVRLAAKWNVSVEDEIWYGAPTFKQAKRVFWRRLKQAIPASWRASKPNETECSITTKAGHVVRIVGLDSYDKPFAEAITYTDIDPVVEEWLENIDLSGNNLTVFAHSVFTEGMAKGLTHILVDMPSTVDKEGRQKYITKADEKAAGLRPYMIHVKPGQVLGWRSQKGADGVERLTMLRMMECIEEDDGPFGVKSVPQVRVLIPGAWATYREDKQKKGEWVLAEEGGTSIDFIPLVTFYTKRTGFMTAVPPLLDLADLNIKHWQSSSDQDSILHTARVPLLSITGLQDDDKVEIGAKSFLRLPMGAEAKYVEHTGAAIDAGRVSLQDLENQMRAMGAELLVETQVASTATQNNIEDSEAKCQLSRMVQSEEDTLDNALDMMHRWMNLEYNGAVDIYDDFSSDAILATAGPFVLALIQLVNNGLLDKESAFEEMQRYGIINPDKVWQDVQAKLELEGPVFSAPLPRAQSPAPTPAPAPAVE